MKNFRLPLTLLLCLSMAAVLSAQTDDLIDVIAQETCDCFGQKDLSAMSSEQINMEIGMCMMESLSKRPEALNEMKLDYTDQAAMQAFGEKIGTRMVTKCPGVMMKLAGAQQEQNTQAEVKTKIAGTYQGLQGEDFAFLSIEGDDGTAYRLLWLGEFEGADQLEAAKGKRVEVTYKETKCYSPKMSKYLNRKEITSLKILQ